ncbi:MAG: hypothetical protein ACI9XO_000586 [Paraglaciecola sp.]|jgi:hypothetical protein
MQINAQEATTNLPPTRIPIQVFAAMLTIIGVSAKYGFASDKTFTTIQDHDVDISVVDKQHYSIYWSIPIVKQRKESL